jgi:hypothetical protein
MFLWPYFNHTLLLPDSHDSVRLCLVVIDSSGIRFSHELSLGVVYLYAADNSIGPSIG